MTRLRRTRDYALVKNALKKLRPGGSPWPGPLDDTEYSPKLALDTLTMAWPDAVPKPVIGLVRDVDVYPYWTKYRRFLDANDIPYELYDIHRSDWRRRAEGMDLILWRPMSFPYETEECRRKFWVLEHYLDKLCYPTFREAQIYEDKVLQGELLKHYGLPVVPTFISHSEEESLAYVRACEYPAVWKIACGSGSWGVELVRSRAAAQRRVRSVFSFQGRQTYWPYRAQKNYILLQQLEHNAGYDLRVIVVGDHIQGYYRAVPRGEFRASGMNTWYYGELPVEAMRLACRVRDRLGLTMLALDLLADPAEQRFSIIEVSIFTQINDDFELEVAGVPGAYIHCGEEFRFEPAKIVLQDLVVRELLTTRWIAPRLSA